mgnify:CR=1 FL=1
MNLLSIEITMTSLEVVDLINKFREEEGNKGAVRHDNFMAINSSTFYERYTKRN